MSTTVPITLNLDFSILGLDPDPAWGSTAGSCVLELAHPELFMGGTDKETHLFPAHFQFPWGTLLPSSMLSFSLSRQLPGVGGSRAAPGMAAVLSETLPSGPLAINNCRMPVRAAFRSQIHCTLHQHFVLGRASLTQAPWERGLLDKPPQAAPRDRLGGSSHC
ncbi:hypothetical protein EK904_005872 [Melospiza melodia maxima]|nr:hypothetical protein EK904_005872 [Melospiza melodia maxima]